MDDIYNLNNTYIYCWLLKNSHKHKGNSIQCQQGCHIGYINKKTSQDGSTYMVPFIQFDWKCNAITKI